MRWRLTRLGTGFLVGAAGLALAAVAWNVAPADDALARIRSSGTIRIGYAVEAPYALVGQEGRVTGESPEFARLVVARMGIPNIEWIQTSFDSLLSEVADGRFDVVAAGVFITPQRARIAGFSAPTLRVFDGLGVIAGAKGVTSYAEVAEGAARVAVLAGSFEEVRLRDRGVPSVRLVRVPDAAAARSALESGKVDVLALSLPALRWMVADGAQFAVFQASGQGAAVDPADGSDIGFVFARDEVRLRNAWDSAQVEVKGTPEHLEIMARFGFTDADLAASVAR